MADMPGRTGESDTIALFPLGAVLLPGTPQALHVFEPRYRALLADVTGPGARRAFGVVALQRGVEAGPSANTVLADVGTLAEILDVRSYDDGTSDLVTVGSRRFRILAAGQAPSGYLMASVRWLPERDGAVRPGDLEAARGQVGVYRRLLASMTEDGVDSDATASEEPPLPADPVRLSYALTQRLQLSQADRQRLLAAPDAATRIRMAMALLRRETVLLQRTRSVPVPLQSFRVPAALN